MSRTFRMSQIIIDEASSSNPPKTQFLDVLCRHRNSWCWLVKLWLSISLLRSFTNLIQKSYTRNEIPYQYEDRTEDKGTSYHLDKPKKITYSITKTSYWGIEKTVTLTNHFFFLRQVEFLEMKRFFFFVMIYERHNFKILTNANINTNTIANANANNANANNTDTNIDTSTNLNITNMDYGKRFVF